MDCQLSQISDNGMILGLDIGANSVGWVLIRQNTGGQPIGIEAVGVRVFEEGAELDPKSGKSTSRNIERRSARQRRRMLERRRRRMTRTARLLMRAGLLPRVEIPEGIPEDQKASIERIKLAEFAGFHRVENDPYKLRAKALDEKLEPHQLGRVFYHLAHRRGFKSNRKSAPRKEEANDAGKVNAMIEAIDTEMRERGARTYGEYLSRLNPHEQRHRKRYTSRAWFEHEFEAIWNAQKPHYPAVFTDEFHRSLHDAIFNQRPLKSVAKFIGDCELEHGRKRAPIALLMVQRARILQDVNHLRIFDPRLGPAQGRPLAPNEREALIMELEKAASVPFCTIRKLLKVPHGEKINLEEGGRKKLKGNTTAGTIIAVIGEEAWERLRGTPSPKFHPLNNPWLVTLADELVEDLMTIVENEKLGKRLAEHWKFDPEQASKLAGVSLEDGYSRLSRQALRKILRHLEAGEDFAKARLAEYKEQERAPLDLIPPIENLRNPIVQRALAETRRVVNAILRKFGKPAVIRVELARELKKNSEERAELIKRNRANERERARAAERLRNEIGIAEPSRSDVEKVLLLKECGGLCPYTGACIGMRDLFGDHARFHVEHIIPLSRSLDNSFMNKTLCKAEENQRKNNRTPWEAYGESEEWPRILERVKKFKGSGARAKLRRFELTQVQLEEEFLNNFSERQLNDTRYTSRKAAEVLGQLYGNQWRKRIQVMAGGVTAHLRNVWNMNGILNDGPRKTRDDHRHHAVDAICVALTERSTVKLLADAAGRSRKPGKFPRDVKAPWDTFEEDVRKAIDTVVVSHRVNRKIQGAMHKESLYGMIKRRNKNGQFKEQAVIRTPLESLTPSDIKRNLIVDPVIRRIVHAKLAELAGVSCVDGLDEAGLKKAIKMFMNPENHPKLAAGKAGSRPIHKVRVIQAVEPNKIGSGPTERHVKYGNNSHLEIFEVTATRGRTKGQKTWRGEVVPLFEAMRRKRERQPVVRKTDADGNPLVFSLRINDAVEVDWKGRTILANVRKLSARNYMFKPNRDARKVDTIEEIQFQSDETLRSANCRKVMVSPLGEVIRNDGPNS